MLRFVGARRVGFWVLGCLLAGCSGGSASVRPVQDYPFYQERDAVKVAVDPLFSKERAAAEFPGGEAFAEQGLLPVRVVIENGSRQTIRADLASFRLVRANGQSDNALSVQDAFATVKPPVGWWAALPILGPSASAIRNADWFKQFESRALKDTPISSEGSATGFVYFYFPDTEKNLAGIRVVFAFQAESGGERAFAIALQGRRDIPNPSAQSEPTRAASRPSQTPQGLTRVDGADGGVIIRSPAP